MTLCLEHDKNRARRQRSVPSKKPLAIPCRTCGEPVQQTKGGRLKLYCCIPCRGGNPGLSRVRRTGRDCAQCGEHFMPAQLRSRYCMKCADANSHAPRVDRPTVCPVCEGAIEQPANGCNVRRHCSTRCTNRARLWKTRYGLSIEQYRDLWNAQHGACAVCKTVAEHFGDLPVDHNHTTLKVRGLLCGACNPGIGMLQDSPAILRAAIEYLEAA